jgi:hypothetical protein
VLAIPSYALIVFTATGVGRFEAETVRQVDDLPGGVIKIQTGSARSVTETETPTEIEIQHHSTIISGRIEACDRPTGSIGIRGGAGERENQRQNACERKTYHNKCLSLSAIKLQQRRGMTAIGGRQNAKNSRGRTGNEE